MMGLRLDLTILHGMRKGMLNAVVLSFQADVLFGTVLKSFRSIFFYWLTVLSRNLKADFKFVQPETLLQCVDTAKLK